MSSSGGTSEIGGTMGERDVRAPRPSGRRVGIARALGASLLVASALTACDAGRLTGPAALDAGGTVATASASLVGDVTDPIEDTKPDNTIPYEGLEENRCNGDAVPVRGHVSYRFDVPTDLVTHHKVHFHWVVDGTSVVPEGSDLAGNVYHGSAQYEEEITTPFPGMTQTFAHEVRLTSRTAPDMRMKFLFHLTINHNGVPTAMVEKAPAPECRA